MKIDDAKRILEQFINGERNSVGDQWGRDMVLEAYAALTAEVAALRRDAEKWQQAWDHQCANSYDHHTPHMVCIPVSEWKAAEKLVPVPVKEG